MAIRPIAGWVVWRTVVEGFIPSRIYVGTAFPVVPDPDLDPVLGMAFRERDRERIPTGTTCCLPPVRAAYGTVPDHPEVSPVSKPSAKKASLIVKT